MTRQETLDVIGVTMRPMTKPLLLALALLAACTDAPQPMTPECADAGLVRVNVACEGREPVIVYAYVAAGRADRILLWGMYPGRWLDSATDAEVSMDGTCRIDASWDDYQLIVHGAAPGEDVVGEATTSDGAACVVTYRGRDYPHH